MPFDGEVLPITVAVLGRDPDAEVAAEADPGVLPPGGLPFWVVPTPFVAGMQPRRYQELAEAWDPGDGLMRAGYAQEDRLVMAAPAKPPRSSWPAWPISSFRSTR